MGQEPQVIRTEIEQTRERMGDTMDAIGYKTDVKGRAKENISSKVDSVKERLGASSSKASDATPDSEQVKQQAKKAAGLAQENPLGLVVGGVAVGFIAGLLVPVTQKEHEKLGPMADEVKDQARQTGQEALDRGKEVAQQAAQSAAETAKQEGQQHAAELKESTQQSAEQVRGSSPGP
jgi:gas vesicle protein